MDPQFNAPHSGSVPNPGVRAVEPDVPVEDKPPSVVPVKTARRYSKPFSKYDSLPSHTMSLREQIELVSHRIRRSAMPHAHFMALNKLLIELRAQLKPRHVRSPNGIDLQKIQRAEARRKREALAAQGNNNAGN